MTQFLPLAGTSEKDRVVKDSKWKSTEGMTSEYRQIIPVRLGLCRLTDV
jgi:hypothetical protein